MRRPSSTSCAPASSTPSFLTPLFYAGFILYRAGDHAGVEEILRTLAGKRDRLPPLGRSWLDIYVAYTNHRYTEALQHTRLAEKLAPEDPMVALWIGYMARLSNHPLQTVDVHDRFGARPWVGHALGATWTVQLCAALHMLGEYRRELEEARRAQPAGAGQFELRELRRELWLRSIVRRRSSTWSASVERLPPATSLVRWRSWPPRSFAPTGIVMPPSGSPDRAASWYRARLTGAPGNRDLLLGLLDALRWGERWGEAFRSAPVC